MSTSQAQEPPNIPLREGLTIVTAINHPKEGGYETIKTVTRALVLGEKESVMIHRSWVAWSSVTSLPRSLS